jgi:hypothetical protein
MLRRCGFGEKWCQWIAHCISLVSILVNSTPMGVFSSSRGWRQGYPLSSLLFVIVMEMLCGIIYALVNEGLFLGFFVGSRHDGAFNIFHLLFADDTLIFCGANPNHLCNLRCLFLCFEAVRV